LAKKKEPVWPGLLVIAATGVWVFGDDAPTTSAALAPIAQPQAKNRAIVPTQRPASDSMNSQRQKTDDVVSDAPTKQVSLAPLPANETETAPTPALRDLKPADPQTVAVVPVRPKTLYVDASRLNVRTGPSKSDKVIWTVKRDEAVQVTRVEGDWSFLEGARYKGWVFSDFLTPKKKPKARFTTSLPKAKKPLPKRPKVSTAAIKKTLIRRSMAYYSGSCPCPYNRDRGGRRCGGRSAYSRPGGASPLCYARDVSSQMAADFRARQ